MDNDEGAGASAPAFFIVVDRDHVRQNARDGGNRTILRVWHDGERRDCHYVRFDGGEIVYDQKGVTPDGARVAIRCESEPTVVR